MLLSKYKIEKNIIKQVAKEHGVSVAEVRREMEFAIEQAYNTDDPEKRKEFQKLFGKKKPTPEEFINKTSKTLLKEM